MAHYYNAEGRVRKIEYVTKPGQYREPTLRDAKKQGFAPGVTDVMSIMAKPGLERWKVREGVLAAKDLDPGNYASTDAFVLDAIARSKEEASTKADIGRDIHASIEAYYDGKSYGNKDIVHEVSRVLAAKIGPRDWRSEVEFHTTLDGLAYGGAADLVTSGYEIDIKTKEELTDRMVYDEHLIQLAMYRHALGSPGDVCGNLFVSYNGDVELILHEEHKLERGLNIGRAALALWYASKWK